MATVAGQVVLCHAAGAVDKTILRLIIFFIRIRELRMVTELVADTKVFIGGSRNMARFLNDFFVAVCGVRTIVLYTHCFLVLSFVLWSYSYFLSITTAS